MEFKKRMSMVASGVGYLSHQQHFGDGKLGSKMINKRLENARNLYRKDLYAHYGCVNAIEFSNDGEWLASGGDDKRVLMWNVDKALSGVYNPQAMKGEHNSNIFCLGFDSKHSRLFSAGNDEQVILHDVTTGETLDVFLHDEAVYGLSVDPTNENIFASACDDGRVLIWDVRQATNDAFMLAGYTSAFHAVMYNPIETRLLATANAKEGIGLWDIRKPCTCLLRYGGCLSNQSSMSVRFNCTGTHLLALRRRLPPVLYDVGSAHAVAEFDHREYYNSCTMKSCCFAGDNDQYVLSGSDDFKLYVWKIPSNISCKKGTWVNDAHLVLRGHRSIVNQVRYNYTYGILASSGVEKIVKLWNTFPMVGSGGNIDTVSPRDGVRKVYSHEEYINLVLESGQFMTHDYSHHSVQEDPRMMAFFDSLVQRDIEGWTSDSSETSTTTDILNTCFEVQSDDAQSRSSSPSFSSTSDEEHPERQETPELSDGSLSPHALNYLSNLKQRAEASLQEMVSGEEDGNATSDRISQLIAQKRHDQLLRTARATLKLNKKNLLSMKKQCKHKENGLASNDDRTWSVDNARKILSKVLENPSKDARDKRKLLQKRRAKLLKATPDGGHSSDSDTVNEELSQINGTSSAEDITLSCENGLVPKQDGAAVDENFTRGNGAVNACVSASCNLSDVLSVPDSSETSLNREESSTTSIEQNTPAVFQIKNSKHNSRNYRKRSADDMQDDI